MKTGTKEKFDVIFGVIQSMRQTLDDEDNDELLVDKPVME